IAVASSPWSNGTVKRMMSDILRTMKGLLNECCRLVIDWVDFLPVVQWALNAAYGEHY
ncbi:unnamed protein product, partial [Choristocarpus tenellus]